MAGCLEVVFGRELFLGWCLFWGVGEKGLGEEKASKEESRPEGRKGELVGGFGEEKWVRSLENLAR